ncbi:hypothetical protein FRC11_011482, partial [Ceratobasidium sp. 423]
MEGLIYKDMDALLAIPGFLDPLALISGPLSNPLTSDRPSRDSRLPLPTRALSNRPPSDHSTPLREAVSRQSDRLRAPPADRASSKRPLSVRPPPLRGDAAPRRSGRSRSPPSSRSRLPLPSERPPSDRAPLRGVSRATSVWGNPEAKDVNIYSQSSRPPEDLDASHLPFVDPTRGPLRIFLHGDLYGTTRHTVTRGGGIVVDWGSINKASCVIVDPRWEVFVQRTSRQFRDSKGPAILHPDWIDVCNERGFVAAAKGDWAGKRIHGTKNKPADSKKAGKKRIASIRSFRSGNQFLQASLTDVSSPEPSQSLGSTPFESVGSQAGSFEILDQANLYEHIESIQELPK